MTSLLAFLRAEAGNQFVGGGLVLMFTGSVVALCRRLPGQILAWVKGRYTRTITISNNDPLFDYFTYWLNSQERLRQSRFLQATTQLRLEQGGSGNAPACAESVGTAKKKQSLKVFFSPSTGRHFFRYRDVLVSISRPNNSAPAAQSGGEQTGRYFRKEENYLLEALGKNDGSALKDLVQEVIEFGTEETEGVRLYYSVWGHWSSNGYRRMRPLGTVVLPAGDAESVLEDMREFRAAESWYRDLGIPWHKGYLFHGLPGSGKTSLAAALAGELDMDVYLLNLSGTGMDDETLQRLMSDVRPGCMVILEDIDCTVPARDAPQGNKVTLSWLLNCLDGIMSREGCVIVMTTNRREGLDAALTRPGRVDFEMKFGFATGEQISRLAKRIGVGSEGLHGGVMTMAEVQKELLERYRAGKGVVERVA